MEIINPTGYNIFALDYPMTHKYIMGETDKVPELIPFNPAKHVMKYIKQSGKTMLEYISEGNYIHIQPNIKNISL